MSKKTLRDELISIATEGAVKNSRLVDKRAAAIAGKDLLFADTIKNTLNSVFKDGWMGRNTKKYQSTKAHSKPKRLVHVVISDTHFQSLIDPRECPVGYTAKQESRRFGKVVQQVCEYKRQYRKDTGLRVKLLGDLFQGQLHDQREGSPLSLQFAATLHYLIQAVVIFAGEFQEVKVDCVSGNHGRNKNRHHDRAVQQKWDSIEMMVYMALRQAVRGLKNVEIRFDEKPYIVEQIFDQKAFWTHGDTVLKPGYPGRSINVAGLYQQICKWNTARHVKGPFKLFGVGHVHVGSLTNVPGGIAMLTNGCLVPPDPFALSIGSPDVTCGQYIFESTPGYICGDQRFVTVDDADNQPKYNSIITPFTGL